MSRNYVTRSSKKLSAMVRAIFDSRITRTDDAGISLSGIKRKVAAVSMNQVILRKALEGLVKNNVIKTFKPINVSSQWGY
jgi:endonuclease III